MKANEVMIGDWVQISEPDRYAGAPCIIRSLMYHQEDEGSYFHVFISGGSRFGFLTKEVFNEDLRPIPICRVHLVKNGFKAINEEDTDFKFCDGYEIEVMFDGNPKDPIISLSINFAEKELWMEIEYVHQLQQAMRLMGIEKEIML